MFLTSLDVKCLRNLLCVKLEPAKGINYLYGENGSGKTSFLEAIAFLSSGKSFRPGPVSSLIKSGTTELSVYAEVLNPRNNSVARAGLSRSRDQLSARLNGERVARMSDLASAVPSIVISSHNHELIEGGPMGRRSFMDWVAFHVEPSFVTAVKKYRTTIQQRNSALKSRQAIEQVRIWDYQLAASGETISKCRQKVFAIFQNSFTNIVEQFNLQHEVTFEYKRGWSEALDLFEALENSLSQCMRFGNTSTGPHRADLKIRWSGLDAKYVQSRGQQKLVSIIMRLAQIDMFHRHFGVPPIVLFDDMDSELDDSNSQFVLSYLENMTAQVFLTGTDEMTIKQSSIAARFHVEQGAIRKML